MPCKQNRVSDLMCDRKPADVWVEIGKNRNSRRTGISVIKNLKLRTLMLPRALLYYHSEDASELRNPNRNRLEKGGMKLPKLDCCVTS
jgi:hypothetical protein